MHWIHGVIGRPDVVARLRVDATPIALDAGMVLLAWPETQLRVVEDEAPEHEYLDVAIEARIDTAAGDEGLAFIETRYFGGAGGQVGSAWRGGVRVVDCGTVNEALAAIGVVSTNGRDAWEAVGLTRHRAVPRGT